MIQIVVDEQSAGMRLDAFLSANCPDVSRAQIKKSIESGDVTINDKQITKAARKLAIRECVSFRLPEVVDLTHPQPEEIPLNILYSDEHIIVVNKPEGLVVHPGAGHLTGTLVNALLNFDPAIAGIGEPDRPGIVHRLDAETSGLLVVARSQAAYEKLVEMFSEHDVHRQYWAICYAPKLDNKGTFDTPYGRHPTQRVKFTSFVTRPDLASSAPKRAITHYEVLARNVAGFAFVTCNLETGRTHQIRVHLSEHGAPILGDQLYAPPKLANHRAIQRLALHAGKLSFLHPMTGQPMAFDVPLPKAFIAALRALNIPIE